MQSTFLFIATLLICLLFALVVKKIGNLPPNSLWIDKIFSFFTRYSSWILATISIVLYILSKKGVFAASLLMIPYIFLMSIEFFEISFESNTILKIILISGYGLLLPCILIISPHFWIKFIISLFFLIIAAKNIYTGMKDYIENNKTENFLEIAFYPLPILIFFIITLLF